MTPNPSPDTAAPGFSEQSLRQAIVNTWGPAGAHADVFDHMLSRIAVAEAEVAELRAALGRLRELHVEGTEAMVTEEELDSDGDLNLVDVKVCAYCWHLIYPEGCDDEYVDPDVFWPCATMRAAAALREGEPE